MKTPDAFAEWDAAYVLGALDPGERRDFEEHLLTCSSCQAAVAELAGMPGLLAQLPPGEVLAMDHPGIEGLPAPPVSLMPDLPVDDGRGTRVATLGRRRWLALGAVAAAALLIGGIGGYAANNAGGGPSPTPTATAQPSVTSPTRLAFSAVEPASMTAVVDVIPQGSGTLLRVECQYAVGTETPGEPDYQGAWADYSIWVVGKSGESTEIKRWTARPDKVMHPSGVSALPVSQIESVEIRRVDSGETVMRANLT
jgi:hypothetical protein